MVVLQGVTGLEDPEIFGLPAGVQRLQEEESGHALLMALATAGGAQDPAGSIESVLVKELTKVNKMVRNVESVSDEGQMRC